MSLAGHRPQQLSARVLSGPWLSGTPTFHPLPAAAAPHTHTLSSALASSPPCSTGPPPGCCSTGSGLHPAGWSQGPPPPPGPRLDLRRWVLPAGAPLRTGRSCRHPPLGGQREGAPGAASASGSRGAEPLSSGRTGPVGPALPARLRDSHGAEPQSEGLDGGYTFKSGCFHAHVCMETAALSCAREGVPAHRALGGTCQR